MEKEKIRRMINMTKFDKIIEKERIQAEDKVRRATKRKVTKTVSEDIARNFLKSGSSPEIVSANTKLPIERVLELKAGLAQG